MVCPDEIDAIGTKRYESQSGGEREIQRTMLELLNQLDGFDSMGDVKVCTYSQHDDFQNKMSKIRGLVTNKLQGVHGILKTC